MTTSHSPAAASPSSSNGEYLSSLPRWRQFLLGACNTARHLGATLNWRRDPGYEQRINAKLIEIEQIKKETEKIKKETEQLRLENVKLRTLNAKTKTLLSYVDQHCFPPESNSAPIPPIETGSSS
jgi:hypothetical protein